MAGRLLNRRVLVLKGSLIFILAVALAGGLLLGCGTGDGSDNVGQATTTGQASTTIAAPETATTATEAPPDGEIVIGALNSMTGSDSLSGEEQHWAYEKAVADINAGGGVTLADGKRYYLALRFADDRVNPAEGTKAMEKLIAVDGIRLILSSNILPINEAAGAVAEKYGAYYHANTSWTDVIASHKFQWTSCIFMTRALAAEVPINVCELQPEAERPRRWAIMVEDTSDGKDLGERVKAAAEALGYDIVLRENFIENTVDFRPLVRRMQENNIDAVVTLVAPTDAITLVKQMKELGFSPKLVFGYKGFWPVEFMKALGSDSDYLGYDGFWSESLPYPGCAELGHAFSQEHNGCDSVKIGPPYASVQILAEAIRRAGSTDPGAVRDQVFGGTFKGTVMGDVTYGEDGIASIPALAMQWIDGKRVICYPDYPGITSRWTWFVQREDR
jgi:branched-chain amino acid transport system substrate-binding protein